ncbi:MAG: FeoB-associated Cys-rich membrane protein [Candidatus Pacebacteria bacterium]|nr:FeoB-associated Cys-rich membrane protein [Candidatus Paceibacterota bacterium]
MEVIIVIGIAVLAGAYLAWMSYRRFSGKSRCESCCGSCSVRRVCNSSTEKTLESSAAEKE